MARPLPSKKARSRGFVCNECGGETVRWGGQCPHCKAWDTLVEAPAEAVPHQARGRVESWTGAAQMTESLDKIGADDTPERWSTGLGEFDRVLGGGVVPGSVVLLGGDPGIGKSTLVLQAMAAMSPQHACLYITGEESLAQVAARGQRLELSLRGVAAFAETCVERIVEHTIQRKPSLVIADSIQTLYSEANASAPGTVSQVRDCAAQLTRLAKQAGIAVWLIGHVTKEGTLAGPRVLEHMVDTVLYFEGDPQSPYRLVRALKNRFGSMYELGAFEMTERGLRPVDNPSAMFLAADRQPHPGSCVCISQEGQRALMLDIQALSDDARGGNPKRVAVGLDATRLAMLIAVLHRHGGLDLTGQDIFINAVGGMRLTETAVDLPLLLALIGSLTHRALPTDLVCFGEIGLTGEVRPVQRAETRLREAAAQGFTYALVPARNKPDHAIPGLTVQGVATVADAVRAFESLSQRLPLPQSA